MQLQYNKLDFHIHFCQDKSVTDFNALAVVKRTMTPSENYTESHSSKIVQTDAAITYLGEQTLSGIGNSELNIYFRINHFL